MENLNGEEIAWRFHVKESQTTNQKVIEKFSKIYVNGKVTTIYLIAD